MTKSEKVVLDRLNKMGFEGASRGWPDFLVWKVAKTQRKAEKVWMKKWGCAAVEVKRTRSDKLSEHQELIHAVLRRAGVPVYVIYADEIKKATDLDLLPVICGEEEANIKDTLHRLEREVQIMENTVKTARKNAEKYRDVIDRLASCGELFPGDNNQPVSREDLDAHSLAACYTMGMRHVGAHPAAAPTPDFM